MREKFNCILLIDDDIATNEFHEIVIEDADVANAVHAVTSGQEALDFLTNQGQYNENGPGFPQPDLIFLDINMPAMNGFEFVEKYESLNANQKGEIMIVMLTSSLNPDDKLKADTLKEVAGFRNKPLTEEVLIDLLERYR